MRTTTNWSQPYTNIFKAIRSLYRALAAGQTARLVRMRNEDCEHPIKVLKADKDFRNYKFTSGTLQTRSGILADNYKTEFQKHLSLNYRICYGTQDALEHYYETGELGIDNIKGMGVSHLVRVEDLVQLLETLGDNDRAKCFREQYLTLEEAENLHFYDNYVSLDGTEYEAKKFRTKLWVVVLYHGYENRQKYKMPFWMQVIMWLQTPLKYIPKKQVLKMDKYKSITYRIGSIQNGFSLEIGIPKKFSF